MNWVIVTGAYPPDEMGLADYTVRVAEELAARGDGVWVFAGSGPVASANSDKVKVRRFPAHFGLRALALMSWELRKIPRPRQIVLHYVPQAFGPRAWMQKRRFRGVPLSLCLWLQARREKIWPVFFEAAVLPAPNQSLPMRLLGATTRWMVRLIARRSSRIFVATPVLAEVIRKVLGKDVATEWLPVPSTLAVRVDQERVAELRRRLLGEGGDTLIGHFSSYRPPMAEPLYPIVESLLRGKMSRRLVLIGRGSGEFAERCRAAWPELSPQLLVADDLPAEQAAEHIAACDVMVEPYEDGVTGQRTTMMAPLALGCLVVTNDGPWTEPLWRESGAVAFAPKPDAAVFAAQVEEALAARPPLGERAARLYDEQFAVRHIVEALTGAGAPARITPRHEPRERESASPAGVYLES